MYNLLSSELKELFICFHKPIYDFCIVSYILLHIWQSYRLLQF